MRLMRECWTTATEDILNNISIYNGIEYIQYIPLFYMNCGTLNTLFFYGTEEEKDLQEKFYCTIGYGRKGMIEGLRADQLIIGNTGLPFLTIVRNINCMCNCISDL